MNQPEYDEDTSIRRGMQKDLQVSVPDGLIFLEVLIPLVYRAWGKKKRKKYVAVVWVKILKS